MIELRLTVGIDILNYDLVYIYLTYARNFFERMPPTSHQYYKHVVHQIYKCFNSYRYSIYLVWYYYCINIRMPYILCGWSAKKFIQTVHLHYPVMCVCVYIKHSIFFPKKMHPQMKCKQWRVSSVVAREIEMERAFKWKSM